MHYAAQTNHAKENIVDVQVQKLERRQKSKAASPSRRFSICSTISGDTLVIDADGREVATRPFQHEADGICATLNKAAQAGPQAVSDALLSL